MTDQQFETPPLDTRLYCRNSMDWGLVRSTQFDEKSILASIKAIILSYHEGVQVEEYVPAESAVKQEA